MTTFVATGGLSGDLHVAGPLLSSTVIPRTTSMAMGSLEQEEELSLVQKISEIYDSISKLSTLKPSENVNNLFRKLVTTCIPPSTVDVSKLSRENQSMRSNLIKLCGMAEGLLECHYSSLLSAFNNSLDHLTIFPYYHNYLKLSRLEHTILARHSPKAAIASRLAFIGSGRLPLTSIVLAKHHMRSSVFHNYDIDPLANSMALRLTSADEDLSQCMVFHTTNIMNVTSALKSYDVIFLAALVGMDKGEKLSVIEHLAEHMAPGAVLMLRSAVGACAFLYPVVDPCDFHHGFEVLLVFHPTDDVINSVVISRKRSQLPLQRNSEELVGGGNGSSRVVLPCRCCCSKIQGVFGHGSITKERVLEEQDCICFH